MIDLIVGLFNFIMHIDEHLKSIVSQYPKWVYGILFLIVFVETGVVIMPFLPGDSLLFAAGAMAAIGGLNLWTVLGIFFVAAILGDSLNYEIGKKVGGAISNHRFFGRFIKKENLDQAHAFFEKHGGKTVMIARFMPLIRTFIPFVAGASKMRYPYFIMYNVAGALLWVLIAVFCGYFFGNIKIVKDNFSVFILGIVFVSILPAIIGLIAPKFKKK